MDIRWEPGHICRALFIRPFWKMLLCACTLTPSLAFLPAADVTRRRYKPALNAPPRVGTVNRCAAIAFPVGCPGCPSSHVVCARRRPVLTPIFKPGGHPGLSTCLLLELRTVESCACTHAVAERRARSMRAHSGMKCSVCNFFLRSVSLYDV